MVYKGIPSGDYVQDFGYARYTSETNVIEVYVVGVNNGVYAYDLNDLPNKITYQSEPLGELPQSGTYGPETIFHSVVRDGRDITVSFRIKGSESLETYGPVSLQSIGSSQTVLQRYKIATVETDTEWQDRNQRRLTVLAREIAKVTSHSNLVLKTKSRDVDLTSSPLASSETYKTNDSIAQSDHTINWGRLLIGYAWTQVQAAVSGEADAPAKDTVETLVDKVEANLSDADNVEKFYLTHDITSWRTCHNDRAIHIAELDNDFAPGEVILNINDQHKDNNNVVIEEDAEASFHTCVTDDFYSAWSSSDRELLTTRTYTP